MQQHNQNNSHWLSFLNPETRDIQSVDVLLDTGADMNVMSEGMVHDLDLSKHTIAQKTVFNQIVGTFESTAQVNVTCQGSPAFGPFELTFYVVKRPNERRPILGRQAIQEYGHLLLNEKPRGTAFPLKWRKQSVCIGSVHALSQFTSLRILTWWARRRKAKRGRRWPMRQLLQSRRDYDRSTNAATVAKSTLKGMAVLQSLATKVAAIQKWVVGVVIVAMGGQDKLIKRTKCLLSSGASTKASPRALQILASKVRALFSSIIKVKYKALLERGFLKTTLLRLQKTHMSQCDKFDS